MSHFAKTAIGAFLAVAVVFSAPKEAEAASLGISTLNVPDILSNSLDAIYTAGTGALTVTQDPLGTNRLENPDTVFTDLGAGTFSLTADLSNLAAPTGTMSVGGFEFDLLAVGNDGNTIEFLWSVTTNPGNVYSNGQALTLLSNTNYNGDEFFGSDFDTFSLAGIGFAAADTLGVVPVPAGLPLLVSGVLAFGVIRRRRRKA